MFEHYKDCLFNSKTIIKLQQRFRSDHHRVYTGEVNKIALSSNDDKRLQTFDGITAHPIGTNAFKVCGSEMRYVILKKIILKLLTHRNKHIIKKDYDMQEKLYEPEMDEKKMRINKKIFESSKEIYEVNKEIRKKIDRINKIGEKTDELNKKWIC